MTSRPSSTSQRGRATAKPEDAWLADVAAAAAASSGTPVELLREYLTFLADAAVSGRRPQKRELEAVRELGRRAAEQAWAPARRSTCTCRQRGDCGENCRRWCGLVIVTRCVPPPMRYFA